MIIGTGIDIVQVERIDKIYARFGEKFLNHILTPLELPFVPRRPAAFLASRFAAKEACVKALGTGFMHGITPKSISVRKAESGQPALALHDYAHIRAMRLGMRASFLSISHEKGLAIAMVILEN